MALDFPASSASPYTAPNGVIYTWNTDGYWEAVADSNDFDTDYLKVNATNGPVTGALAFEQLTTHEVGVRVTSGGVSAPSNLTITTGDDGLPVANQTGKFSVRTNNGLINPRTGLLDNQIELTGTQTGSGVDTNPCGIRSDISTDENFDGAGSGIICAYQSRVAASGTGNALNGEYTHYLAPNKRTSDLVITGELYGFRSGIDTTSATTAYNFYAGGTAPNYFAGNVGIGTNNPQAQLHLATSSNGRILFNTAAASNGYDTRIETTDEGLEFTARSSVRGFRFNTGEVINEVFTEVPRVVIEPTGNVGIGMTNPKAKLEVEGVDSAPSLTWDNESIAILGTSSAQLSIGRDTNDPFSFYLQSRKSDSTARDITLNPVGGNVGIGTSDPATTLEVFDPTARDINAYTSPLSIGNNGTNTNNGHKLGEGPALNFRLKRSANGGETNCAYIRAVAEGDLGSSWPTSLSFATRRFGDDPEEHMRIESTGNVGIGTQNPTGFAGACQLAVSGSGGARIGVSGRDRTFYLEGRTDIDGFTIGARGTNNTVDVPKVTLLTAGGITFGSDTSTDNALDDYEEGTWTPVLVQADGQGTFTHSVRSGSYTKVGRIVTCQGQISLSAVSNTSASSLRIGGFPFKTINDSNSRAAGSVGIFQGFQNRFPDQGLVMLHNSVVADLQFTQEANTTSNVRGIDVKANCRINFSITYVTPV